MTWRAINTLLLLVQPALAQPTQTRDPVEDACQRVLAEIEPTAGQTADRPQQIASIRAFLDKHTEFASHAGVLRLRTRLGTLLLHSCRFDDAQVEFRTVVDHAPPAQRDFLGRARYGLAQALELLDDTAGARRLLQEIVTLHAGERYARFAKVALERLEQPGAIGPQAGQQAPPFATDPLVDLDERQHRLRAYADRPLLLVFWSPQDQDSITRLRTAAAAWQRGGGTTQTVLAFALATSTEIARQRRKKHELSMPIIVCDDEFVHDTALAYRVNKLPTVVMISPGGTVIGRDLPASEIERIVRLVR